jgi:hypothetical protein
LPHEGQKDTPSATDALQREQVCMPIPPLPECLASGGFR